MLVGSSCPMTTKSSKFLWDTQEPKEILKIINDVMINSQISSELNEFSCQKNIQYSAATAMECLLVDLCSGFILKEDVELITNIYNLFKKKVIEIDPFQYMKDVEKRFNYGNKTLPINITDKMFALFKKTNLSSSLAS